VYICITYGKKYLGKAIKRGTLYMNLQFVSDFSSSLTEQVMVENLSYKDGQEGISAFIQKRKPTWSHDDEKAH